MSLLKWKKFQTVLRNLYHIQGEKAQLLTSSQPGLSSLVNVIEYKLTLLGHL